VLILSIFDSKKFWSFYFSKNSRISPTLELALGVDELLLLATGVVGVASPPLLSTLLSIMAGLIVLLEAFLVKKSGDKLLLVLPILIGVEAVKIYISLKTYIWSQNLFNLFLKYLDENKGEILFCQIINNFVAFLEKCIK